jgi:hypothetical protein
MTKPRLSDKEHVNEYIANLDANIKPIIEYIRQIILAIDPEITQQIKWNSMSFYYAGEMASFNPKEYKRDILVCNLHRGQILLVFPTAAKIADGVSGKNYPDGRKIITIKDLEDFKNKQNDISQVVNDWLALVDKG